MQYLNILSSFTTLMLASQIAAQTKHPLEDLLVVADRHSIRTCDLMGKQCEVIAKIGGISVDYDCTTGELLWLNPETQQVYAQGPKEDRPRVVVHKRQNWIPIAIAVDSITHKVYIADQGSGTVSLYDLDSSKFTVIINSNLTVIYGMAIDLEKGYLFIHDSYQIIRTDLDGKDRRIIYHDDIQIDGNAASSSSQSVQFILPLTISRITVHPTAKRLYWANVRNQEIISLNYEGTDKKVHFLATNKFSFRRYIDEDSVAIIKDHIYWSNNERQIYKINLNTRNKAEFTAIDVQARFIKAISCSNRSQMSNPCKKNNGGCQDLCILSKNKKQNFVCACKVGYQLSDDKKSCIRVQDYIVFAMEQRLRGLSISNAVKPESSVEVIDPGNFNVQYNTNLEVNAENGVVYWSSTFPDDTLHNVRLSDGLDTILEPNLLTTSVSKLAFDWVSRNLYYLTSSQPSYSVNWKTISVLNIDKPTFSKIVINKLKSLMLDILVHPNQGYLYYSQVMRSNGMITRAGLDGSNPTVIYKRPDKQFRSMALDYEKERLYWIEVQNLFSGLNAKLRHSNLAGEDVQNIEVPADYADLNSIAIHGNFIYAIAKEKSIIRFNKLGGSQQLLILTEYKMSLTVSDIRVFSLAGQTPSANHPCARGHQCEKFCFTVPSQNGRIKGVCGCPYGEILAANGRSCDDNSQQEPAVAPYKSNSLSLTLHSLSLGQAAPAA